MSVASVLLLFDLLFLPWHRISFEIAGLGSSTVSRSGIQSPNGFLGLLAALVLVAIVARIEVVADIDSCALQVLRRRSERH